jgi:hypothetical protein
MRPPHALTGHLVYSASGSVVDSTVCDGKVIVRHREIEGEADIIAGACEVSRHLFERVDAAGVARGSEVAGTIQKVGVRVLGHALDRAYDASGQRLMHLQAAIDGFDVFARSLSIGPETMIMKFRPDLPMHDRYPVDHEFLSSQQGAEVLTVSRLVNMFFRWEFNSCECLVRGDQVHPIDYANASPDVAVTSLHYYFPWAMKTLLKWCAFCLVTGRRALLDLDTRRYFEIADREDLGYEDKLAAYRQLADEYFEADRYQEFCANRLPPRRRAGTRWVGSVEFDRLLVNTVRSTYPAHEQERFIEHLRGLVGQWVREQGRQPAWAA